MCTAPLADEEFPVESPAEAEADDEEGLTKFRTVDLFRRARMFGANDGRDREGSIASCLMEAERPRGAVTIHEDANDGDNRGTTEHAIMQR